MAAAEREAQSHPQVGGFRTINSAGFHQRETGPRVSDFRSAWTTKRQAVLLGELLRIAPFAASEGSRTIVEPSPLPGSCRHPFRARREHEELGQLARQEKRLVGDAPGDEVPVAVRPDGLSWGLEGCGDVTEGRVDSTGLLP